MRGWVNVKTFTDDPLLCPVLSLRDYLARTTQFRETDRGKLFLSYIKPHKAVSAQTLARWMRDILKAAGIDTAMFSQHSTRSASAAHLRNLRAATVKQICQPAHWSQMSGTYRKLYDRIVLDT